MDWIPQAAALEEMGDEKQVEDMFQVGRLLAWLLRHWKGRADHTRPSYSETKAGMRFANRRKKVKSATVP